MVTDQNDDRSRTADDESARKDRVRSAKTRLVCGGNQYHDQYLLFVTDVGQVGLEFYLVCAQNQADIYTLLKAWVGKDREGHLRPEL